MDTKKAPSQKKGAPAPSVRAPKTAPALVTRAERRRAEREHLPSLLTRIGRLPHAKAGEMALATLPFVLLALAELVLWGWRNTARPTTLGQWDLVVHLPVITGAAIALNRNLPRWGVPWVGAAIWGFAELVRRLTLTLLALADVPSASAVWAGWGVIAVGAVVALLGARALKRRSNPEAWVLVASFLIADLIAISLNVLSLGMLVSTGMIGAAVATLQVALLFAALRWTFGGWRPGPWILVGLVLASPLFALYMTRVTGLLLKTPNELIRGWWPLQAAVLLVALVLLRGERKVPHTVAANTLDTPQEQA